LSRQTVEQNNVNTNAFYSWIIAAGLI